mmetsp:Transcript_62114/g.166234  ORF Transcript_62114/g.166234 Transcript_62114/m.166234 type:complete len:499 (-) Transcript_62114:42-1538(-)
MQRAVAIAFLLHVAAAARLLLVDDGVALLQSSMLVERDDTSADSPEKRLEMAMSLARAQGSGDASSGFSQPLINFGDAQYVSYMQVGKYMISGLVDTGSFELVVFGSECRTCSVAAHYSHSMSNTFEGGTLVSEQNYGSGRTLCNESFEQVSIGPYPPTRQMFWEVVDAEMPVLQYAAFEAIIGVGPTEAALLRIWDEADFWVKNLTSYYDQAIWAPPEAVMDAQQMVKIGIELGNGLPMLHTWKVPVFSICIGANSGADGVVIWNDTRPVEKAHLFQRVPVLGNNHTWSALLSEPGLLSREGKRTELSACASGCEALIDSGSSLLGAPSDVISALTEYMEKLDADCSNLEDLPDLVFKLGNNTAVSLPPTAYVAQFDGAVSEAVQKDHTNLARSEGSKRSCQLAMTDSGSAYGEADLWVLGVPWFRKYFTSFELGEELDERTFHIAEHQDEACEPKEGSFTEVTADRGAPMGLRTIQANRLHLPHPRRGFNSRVFRA